MAQSLWVNNGSYLHSPELSRQMRMQADPMFVWRQFTEVKDAFGLHKGDTYQFSKQLRIDTRGGTLIETDTMPANEIKFLKDSVSVTEWGNGVNFTQKIESLSEFTIRDQKQKGLVTDQKDSIDTEVARVFKTGEFKAVCSASATTVITTNGTAVASATVNPSDKNIRDIVSHLKKKHVPMIDNHYVGILSVEAHAGLYGNLQAIAQYADPKFRFTAETGRYYSVRFLEDMSILLNTIGHGSALGEGVVFGDEAVCEAVALAEELRYEETDVGRSKKLAWYAILGFKKIWSQASDDSNSTGKGIERIVHITSA